MYLFKAGEKGGKKVQLMGSGTIFQEVLAAADLLKQDFGVDADIWSCPSFNLLHRDAIEVERYNRLHPLEENKLPFVTSQLQGHEGPVVAATDYVRSFADRIRAYIPNDYHVLGTDGFGRSDSRGKPLPKAGRIGRPSEKDKRKIYEAIIYRMFYCVIGCLFVQCAAGSAGGSL